nr:unnamed protein product [Digitaria exilis]
MYILQEIPSPSYVQLRRLPATTFQSVGPKTGNILTRTRERIPTWAHVWRPPREFQMTIPPFSDPASTATRSRAPAQTKGSPTLTRARSPAAGSSGDDD